MHDGNGQRQQGGRNHRAVDCLRAGIERQPEAEYGKNGRESGEGKIETDGNSALIGEHGDKMGGPDAEPRRKGGNQDPIGLSAGRTFLSAQQEVKKGEHSQQTDQCRKKHDLPIVLDGNAFQHREHDALSQPLKNRSRWHYESGLFINL